MSTAIPYGVYDLTGNTGWVHVGTDHDTATFAVESIRRWWKAAGRSDYRGPGGFDHRGRGRVQRLPASEQMGRRPICSGSAGPPR